jgi:hypothetical protein
MCTDWDYINVRDFEYLNSMWEEVEPKVSIEGLQDSIERLGSILINKLDIPIAETPLDSEQSKFFKEVYQNPTRLDEIIDIE